MIIGPVLALTGVAVILFSFEICIRYQNNARRVQDPEIDTMETIHHIKHWADPGNCGII